MHENKSKGRRETEPNLEKATEMWQKYVEDVVHHHHHHQHQLHVLACDLTKDTHFSSRAKAVAGFTLRYLEDG